VPVLSDVSFTVPVGVGCICMVISIAGNLMCLSLSAGTEALNAQHSSVFQCLCGLIHKLS